ncbi:7212_t:CDS:1, partial [Racocetra persica]
KDTFICSSCHKNINEILTNENSMFDRKMGKDNIHLTFLVISTGIFFGYRSIPNGISISKNESVDALHTKIWNYYFNEYGNVFFNLRAVDIERREYV